MTVITGSQIDTLRLLVVCQGIESYVKSNGRMRLTRTATPANLRAIASEYTGKTYARSRKGLEEAGKDCRALYNEVTANNRV